MVNLKINGIDVQATEDTTIMKGAQSIGIDVPNFCYSDFYKKFSGCRICVVEVKGRDRLAASCSETVQEGMEIETESPRVVKVRKDLLELIWANHPEDCLTCEKVGTCKLQEYCFRYGVSRSPYEKNKDTYELDTSNPVMIRNQNKCILCGKCVNVCREVQGTTAIDFIGRGIESKIATGFDLPLNTDNCRFCGQCISECPTGAILNKHFTGTRPWEIDKKVKTTCPFCGTGCQFELNVKDNKVVGVTPFAEAIVNNKSLCVKGRFHIDMITSEERLKYPLIKRNGVFERASWEEAIAYVAKRLSEIKEKHGGDAIAGLSSARCVNEDNFVFQKFMRVALQTNNVDHCART